MYKEKLTFKNFNGDDVETTLRFHFTELEIMDLVKDDPTFSQSYMRTIVENEDQYEMFRFLRKILALSYGELSDDGNTFMKSQEIMDRFLHSAAYDALIDKIAASADVNVVRNMLLAIFPPKFGEAYLAEEKEKSKAVTAVNA